MSEDIARLEARVRALEARLAVSGEVRVARQVRLAVTCDPATGSYPVPDDVATCWPIKFIDGSFDDTDEDGDITATERSGSQLAFAFNLRKQHLPVGTVVPVVCQNGQWWMDLYAPWHFGKLDDEMVSTAGTPATVSIWTWSGSAWADSTENVEALPPPLLSSGSIASGKWVRVEFHVQSGYWYVVSAEC